MVEDHANPDRGVESGTGDIFLSSGDVRTGFISGVTFRNKPVQFQAVDGLAIFEGCICLGRVEEVERQAGLVTAAAEEEVDETIARGIVVSADRFRWPNARMPYEIDDALPDKQRVTDAVAHWEARTNLRFVRRTADNAPEYPNYVRVFRGTGCWSRVGMRGGRQELSLADGCGFGAAVHEFGHAWGLWHEQSREDRDTYVQIHWDHIQAGREHNFNQRVVDGDDVGPYDYASIMHYGSTAFSRSGAPTISPRKSGVTIGQRHGLSDGDVAAVHHIYRTTHHGLRVQLTFSTPHSRNAWANLDGLGWRKIHPNAPDGVTNTLVVLATARAFDRTVSARLDGTYVYQAYQT